MDATEDELAKHFGKVGILEISPENSLPRIKLYRDKESELVKGDASICYANEASVGMAVDVLNGGMLRADGTGKLCVTRASFQQKGEKIIEDDEKMDKETLRKRKMAKLAAAQAVSWDTGENGRIAGGAKGLTIVVIKNAFTKEELEKDEDAVLRDVEKWIVEAVEKFGTVEKITVFSKSRENCVTVKFKEVDAANTCVEEMNGRANWRGKSLTIKVHFWDGVTDYTNVTEEDKAKDEEQRLEDFGNWIENQELPEEFRQREE